ncbi:MAG: DUF1289 domain-containing protein [Pseudomonadales bacterium]|nr:DUF1289 domain-containing protein [Pseudomonadales bacterium]
MIFSPCNGKCTDQGTHCEGCGRTHTEVAETRKMVADLVAYAQKKGYENVEDYANSIARSVIYKLQNP